MRKVIRRGRRRIILVIPPTGMEEWTEAALMSAHHRLTKKGAAWRQNDLIRSLSA